MKVLQIIPSVDPAGGGPIEAVRQCGLHWLQLGHRIEVLTLDDPAETFLVDFPLPVHALGPASGSYRYTDKLVPWLRQHAANYDAVVINGLWQYHSFGTWRALRTAGLPYYVFTHGMLDPWFKRHYPFKHLKKWAYWPWAEYRVLRDAQAVLFTCEEERQLARQSFWLYRARERVVAFGTSEPPQDAERLRGDFLAAHPLLRNKRLVLFLGRIHEKKGCDLLVRAFIQAAELDPSLHLVVAGPDQSGMVPQLKDAAQATGLSDRITWPGMLQGEAKWGLFHASEVFMLPSHQENFGIAVAEALGCGLPVLISDKVNIWREIEADGAGMVETDNQHGANELLRRWLSTPETVRQDFRSRARESFRRRFSVESMATGLIKVFAEAVVPSVVSGGAA